MAVLATTGCTDEELTSFEAAALERNARNSAESFCDEDRQCLEEIDDLIPACASKEQIRFEEELATISLDDQFEYQRSIARTMNLAVTQCVVRGTTRGARAPNNSLQRAAELWTLGVVAIILRYIKIALSLSLAAWGLVAGIMNLVFYADGLAAARLVVSMPESESIRSVASPVLHHISYSFIYLGKFGMGAFCTIGTLKLWQIRNDAAEVFNRAKAGVLAGAGVGLFMLFFGFFVLAGSYFNQGGRVPIYFNLHQYATFYLVGIGVVSWFISLKDGEV